MVYLAVQLHLEQLLMSYMELLVVSVISGICQL